MVAAALALALVALPAGAAAKEHRFVEGASREASLAFSGSNGFKFQIGVSGYQGGGSSEISVVAKNGPVEGTYIGLEGASFAPDGSIHAHLRGVGHVDVRFHEISSKKVPLLQNCRGEPGVQARGVFRGSIAIRGRRGFTTASIRNARGTITKTSRQVCSDGVRQGNKSKGDIQITSLLASGHADAPVSFGAVRFEAANDPNRPIFIASAISIQHGIGFIGSAHVIASAATFAVPSLKTLEDATVEPPAPFTGTAEFHSVSPKESTWEGDLAVELPGFGKVPLTGPDFESTLCSDDHCADNEDSPTSGGSFFFALQTIR